MEVLANPQCPECSSRKVVKDGIRYTSYGEIQRFLCRNCGYRFSNGHMSERIHNCSKVTKDTIYTSEYASTKSKNSLKTVKVLNQLEGKTTEIAGTQEPNVKGKILEHAWWLKKQGFREYTIKMRMIWLTLLVKRGANLNDPEHVKEVIAQQETWNENTKLNVVSAYDTFLRMQNLKWQKPKYKPLEKLPFIPLESELDQLISTANRKLAAFLETLKQTGMRSGEAWRLRWINIDFKSNIIRLNDPEKYSNPRQFKVCSNLLTMLNLLPKKNDYVFGYGNLKGFGCTYMKLRKRLAHKLQNPRLLEISFHTFRHWKATMEYHKTKDILYVRQLLGHKNINNTLKYTQLINFENDEWHSATAKTTKEAEKLIESGFEYVCTTPEETMLFRKRK